MHVADLEAVVGFPVINPRVYEAAFTHKSFEKSEACNYERLEFLGDAIINMVTTRYLFVHQPNASVGELTQMRARLVNGKCLSFIAKAIGLPTHMRMSRRALERNVHTCDRICEDVFEALVGAIYMDMGLAAAEEFFMRTLRETGAILRAFQDTNFKDRLNRVSNSRLKCVPAYTTLPSAEPGGGFVSTVSVNGDCVGRGHAMTKKEAEQDAAARALTVMACPA
jgi:ribonuclease-3